MLKDDQLSMLHEAIANYGLVLIKAEPALRAGEARVAIVDLVASLLATAREEERERAEDLSWVPKSCRLSVYYDPLFLDAGYSEAWDASLRLRRDYLGYLVSVRGATAALALEAARLAYLDGVDHPEKLAYPTSLYFREAAIRSGGKEGQ